MAPFIVIKTENLPMISMLRKEFETELSAICEDLLGLLDNYLIPAAQPGEAKVFYLKMKGDYHKPSQQGKFHHKYIDLKVCHRLW